MIFLDKKKNKVLLIYTAVFLVITLICYGIHTYSDDEFYIYEHKTLQVETPLFFQNVGRESKSLRFIQDKTSYGINCQNFQLCADLSNATLLNAKYIVRVKTCQKVGISMTQQHGKHEWLCNISFTQAQFKNSTGNIIDYQLSKKEINEILGKQTFPFEIFIAFYFLCMVFIFMLYDIFVKSKQKGD